MIKKAIVDIVHNNTYSGIKVVPTQQVFNSGLFPLDFHMAFMSIKDISLKSLTKRLNTYFLVNYEGWVIKYYNIENYKFYTEKELIDKFPDRIIKRGEQDYLSLKGLVHSVVKPEWNNIDDLLDYIVENEKIVKKTNKRVSQER